MGFKIKKTKKQRIVGIVTGVLFLLIMFCIIYFLTFFFSLSSSTHPGQKIIEEDWHVVITENSHGYNAEQGIIFNFKDNGKYSIEYEDGTKISSGFYKLSVDEIGKNETERIASGKIKLLSMPFMSDFPDEWGFGQLRNDLFFKFDYSYDYSKDKEGNTIYEDDDYNVMSNVMTLSNSETIFKVVLEGTDEFKELKTSVNSLEDDKTEDESSEG